MKKTQHHKLETVQWRTTKMLSRLEHTPYEKGEGILHIQSEEKVDLKGTQEQLSINYEKVIKITVPGCSCW